MINFDISGKVAVITGGAGILCTTMAKELAKIGVRVAVLDIAEGKAQEVAADIVANGGDAIGVGVAFEGLAVPGQGERDDAHG